MESKQQTVDTRNLSVFFIGDVHVGNSCFDEYWFKKDIEMIRETAKTRDVRIVGMGDYIDAITVDDKKRFSPSEIDVGYTLHDLKDLPRKQMRYFYKLIEPVKEHFTHAFIGNHEESYIKHNSFDLYDYFCTDLMGGKCEKLGFSGYLTLSLRPHGDRNSAGSRRLTIAGTHGSGGGGFTAGYTKSHLVETFRWYRCDVYVMGHVHHCETYSPSFRTTNSSTCKPDTRVEHYISNGCYLRDVREGTRNYFEGRKGTPPDIGCVELRMDYCNHEWESKVIKHIHV